jgi:DNA-binding response OmpR family regulator
MSVLHGISQGWSSPPTVLVVDSDFRSVRALAQALRLEGIDVIEATSFQDGKTLLSHKPDVLIADIRLGQYNGLQLLMRARNDRPEIQAIITSPFPDSVLEAETRRFGGTFVTKPVDPRYVIEAVRNTLAVQTAQAAPFVAVPTVDRRQADRRNLAIPNFAPDRRMRERRSPTH